MSDTDIDTPAAPVRRMFKPKVLKQVTLGVIKMRPGVPVYVKVMRAMYVGEKVDDQKGPATLLDCTDMETGELGHVIAGAVLIKELTKAYPKDAYVGKYFELIANNVPGKRWKMVSINEIADPTPDIVESQARRSAASNASVMGAIDPAKTAA